MEDKAANGAAFLDCEDGGDGDYGNGEASPRSLAGEHTGLLTNDEKQSLSRIQAELDEYDDFDIPESQKLHKEVEKASRHLSVVKDRLEAAQDLVRRVKLEMAEARHVKQTALSRLIALEHKHHLMIPRPGPLEWVDSAWFGTVCSIVVGLNILFMIQHSHVSPSTATLLDNLFLLWYLTELLLKFGHHRRSLFFGPISAVRWNWLDAAIVISGIVDQWLSPLLFGLGGGGSFLATLRLLRLFRFLRVLKVVKTFLVTDTNWLGESQKFEFFMGAVITLNAVVMSFELDIEWAGWVWVDNGFLAIYVFELLLRLKRWGRHFFDNERDWQWNWLDFVIVNSGILDLWLMPGIKIFKLEVLGMHAEEESQHGSSLASVLKLVRLTRLMRVLRLVRVLRSVPPLYTLLIGVMEAFSAMKWVIVLTLLTLYGGAIVFTNLIGKGMIYGDGTPPDAALEVFGSMGASLFSLFELMNGELSVITPICDQVVGKFLFACFMVISNWAVLAILTAVVSENMIASSNRFAEEELKKTTDYAEQKQKARLLELFEANDPNKNGSITREEWAQMLNDPTTRLELNEGTHLTKGDMMDLFDCLAVETNTDNDGEDGDEGGDAEGGSRERTESASGANMPYDVQYRDLIHSLKANTTIADKRSVLHVMIKMRALQEQVTVQVDSKFAEIAQMCHRIETHVRGEGASL